MPDLILDNGNVYTLDTNLPHAEALAIRHGRILAVGSSSEIRSLATSQTTRIDLEGRTVIPGLIDAHVHFVSFSLSLQQVNLDGATSLQEAVNRVAHRVQQTPAGRWILGRGWDQNAWEEPVYPRKEALDQVAPHHPVCLRRKDGHLLWVNSLTLQKAGITRETPDPEGGQIDRDPQSGEPTGILRENAQDLVFQIIERPSHAEMVQAVRVGLREANRLGVTGIHDCEGPAEFRVFQDLAAEEALTMRVCMLIPSRYLDEAIALGLRTGFGNDLLRIGQVKLFADGTLGSQTALMIEPFEGEPDNRGIALNPKAELREMVYKAFDAGLGTAIHAIGDQANRDMLDIYEEYPHPASRPRCRIEHVQLLHPDDIPRLAKIGVIASMQPTHCTADMEVADRFWGKRARYSYAWKSLLNAGTVLAFGSDCPVETIDPLAGIHAAVTRQRASGEPAEGWYPEERLTVEEAVRAYTWGSAYAAGEERSRGSLTPGKLADMVVLSRDIFRIPPAEILETRVDYTIVQGKVVYQRE
ncbi:MAG: amidohydrolase [Nitrospinota bacterium]|nr:MAG: amidohydrolase [Nitrospinota bacterium]